MQAIPSLFAAVALASAAAAQTTLVANTTQNNGLTAGTPGLFFDLTAGAQDLTITELTTASNRMPGEQFDIEVQTYVGSCLGGPVSSGPGSSPIGWTVLGTATATQGPVANDISLPIDIPDIVVPAGQTVGVVLVYIEGGSRYFGTGSMPPQVFSDGDLTLTTGDSRSAPFTPSGTWFQSRGLAGEITYVVGGGGLGTNYCTATLNSTGAAAEISASGSNVASANNVTLSASNMPPGQFGIFVTSLVQDFVPNVGSGNLCLGGAIGRYQQPGQIQQVDPAGEFSLQIDTNFMPQGAGVVPIAPGETWNFQAWHRDFTTTPPFTNTSNLSNGLEITFQ